MAKTNIIPEVAARWATTNVQDFYFPHLLYLHLQSMEIEKTRQEIYKKIAEESDRRLEIVREAFNSLPVDTATLEDWK